MMGMPFLGEGPRMAEVHTESEAGTPAMATAVDSVAGQAYATIAGQLAAKLAGAPAGPRIVVE